MRYEPRPVSTLTADEVRAIRKDPRAICLIAEEFKLTESHVKFVKRKEVWAWIEDDSPPVLHERRRNERSEQELETIRKDPRPKVEIAKELGMTRKAVRRIKNGFKPLKKVRLSDDEVKEIRADPRLPQIIAEEHEISRHLVWYIKRRVLYKEVE